MSQVAVPAHRSGKHGSVSVAELLAKNNPRPAAVPGRPDQVVALAGGGVVMIALVAGAMALSGPQPVGERAPAVAAGPDYSSGGNVVITDVARPSALPAPPPSVVPSAAAGPAASPQFSPMAGTALAAATEQAAAPVATTEAASPRPAPPVAPDEPPAVEPTASETLPSRHGGPLDPVLEPVVGVLEPVAPIVGVAGVGS